MKYKKLQVNNTICYYEVSDKPNFNIIDNKLSMWKQHHFEIILTYDGFGSIERAIYVGINDYFDPIRINRPHANPNYGPGQSKFEIEYYRQTFSLDFS